MIKIGKILRRKSINYIALLISALTLAAFIYQTSVLSKQQHMSVYPHLMLGHENGGSLHYSYILTNKGVGPAIIEYLRVTDGSGKMYDDLGLYLLDTIPEKYHTDFLISNVTKGQLISPGEKIALFSINNNQDFNQLKDTLLEKTKVEPIVLSNKIYSLINDQKFFIEIGYKSVYEEAWKISNRSKIPEEL